MINAVNEQFSRFVNFAQERFDGDSGVPATFRTDMV